MKDISFINLAYSGNFHNCNFASENKCSCKNEISELKSKIDVLQRLILEMHQSFTQNKQLKRQNPRPFALDRFPVEKQNRTNNKPPFRQLICYNCNRPGHLARNCRSKHNYSRQLNYWNDNADDDVSNADQISAEIDTVSQHNNCAAIFSNESENEKKWASIVRK